AVNALDIDASTRFQIECLADFIARDSRGIIVASVDDAIQSGPHTAMRAPQAEHRRTSNQSHYNKDAFHWIPPDGIIRPLFASFSLLNEVTCDDVPGIQLQLIP